MPAPILVAQTIYAELLERCATTAFGDAFPEEGTFTSKTIKGRTYWYFQMRTAEGRKQRYVGPESPDLLERIAHHKQARDDESERRALVSTLVRSIGLPAPPTQIGNVIDALAGAGVFRLRGVIVGTVAFQSYSPMLGLRLPGALLQTSDIDIAQFTNVSIAICDQTPPMLDILKTVDKTFRAVPPLNNLQPATSYKGHGGLRIDFMTPNEGPDTDDSQSLPALQTEAQPLRFLDFLIHEPVQAVVLSGPGIFVQVPAPERYAIHKLIISQRRGVGVAKAGKDLRQAETLIEALVDKRPYELKAVWEEAYARGPVWRRLMLEGMTQLSPRIRDLCLKNLNRNREILPRMKLTFTNPTIRYDMDRDVLKFSGEALGSTVDCEVSRETLEDHFGANNLGKAGRIEAFQKNRSRIEQMIRKKYLSWPIEEPEVALLKTLDIEKLAGTKN
jgi:hypothetical protein